MKKCGEEAIAATVVMFVAAVCRAASACGRINARKPP